MKTIYFEESPIHPGGVPVVAYDKSLFESSWFFPTVIIGAITVVMFLLYIRRKNGKEPTGSFQ